MILRISFLSPFKEDKEAFAPLAGPWPWTEDQCAWAASLALSDHVHSVEVEAEGDEDLRARLVPHIPCCPRRTIWHGEHARFLAANLKESFT